MTAGPVEFHTSAGACQRLMSHRQLQLSAVTVLLAAAWALVLHAAHCLLASIASGVNSNKAAAKAHLVLLKSISPSKIYKYRFQHAVSNVPVPCDQLAQHECSTPSSPAGTGCGLVLSKDTLQQQCSTVPLQYVHDAECRSKAAQQDHRCMGASIGTRIPMQLNQHQGRLTVALDLDETLLCTYHVEHHSNGCDAMQLVPASRTGSLAAGGSHIHQRNSTWALPWSRGSPGSTCIGRYSISPHCPGLSSDLRMAARASAWMHYTPTAPAASLNSPSNSSDSGSSTNSMRSGSAQLNSAQQPHSSGQFYLGPHTLAVFLRPGWHEFLTQLSSFAEVVLFTAASPHYGMPLANLLDPSGQLFVGRLFADACVSCAGRRGVKDLQVLGRDVRRVVLVDNCLFSFLAQPSNGLPCLPFHGASEDSQLLGVILPLLWSLAQVDGDIRPLLDNMFRVRQWLASKGYHTQQHDAEGAAGAS